MQNTKLHNGTKRKKRRHRFLFGVLLSALLITGALYGREYDISQLKNIEVMETLSSAVSQFGDRKLPVYSVQTTEKKIALSFDCAWGAEDFDSMMETLDKHNVKATFFMTGGFVSDNPECVKTLVEKGHEPGNHSEHHYDMATITAGEMKTEIMDVHKKVKELLAAASIQPPVTVEMRDGTAELTLNLVVKFGAKIPAVAEKVQENVKSAVQNMTNVTVSRVNLVIAGLAAEEQE